MSDKFVKIELLEPDGEIIVFLRNIVIERYRFEGRILYKLNLGPRDSKPISENTYVSLKHMLLQEQFIEVKPVNIPKEIPAVAAAPEVPISKNTPPVEHLPPTPPEPAKKKNVPARPFPTKTLVMPYSSKKRY